MDHETPYDTKTSVFYEAISVKISLAQDLLQRWSSPSDLARKNDQEKITTMAIFLRPIAEHLPWMHLPKAFTEVRECTSYTVYKPQVELSIGKWCKHSSKPGREFSIFGKVGMYQYIIELSSGFSLILRISSI